MTDNEITRAMEDYRNSKIIQSDNGVISIGDILNLIKRKDQQIEALIVDKETLQKALAEKEAEIERLKNKYEIIFQPKAMIRAEAGEEFAEKLKPLVDDGYVVDIIDYLVKEWRQKK